MMLGGGRPSCVRDGDKDRQRCQENGGEAHRISLEHVSRRLCGDFHCFVYAFHWYVSLLPIWLSYCILVRSERISQSPCAFFHSGCMMQPCIRCANLV